MPESGAGDVSAARRDLERLTRFASVSGERVDAAAMHGAAATAAEILAAAGATDVDLIDYGACGPAVVARRSGRASGRQVLLYAHYDVQPAGPLDRWTGDPFVVSERDGRLYGRGVSDDKAGIAIHAAALRRLGDLGLDVTVLVEGEEEINSPHLGVLLDRLDIAAFTDVVVADGTNWAPGVPVIHLSMRGLVDCIVEVATLERSVHSGHFGGGAPDGLSALCRLLASLHNDAGNVAIAGVRASAGLTVPMSADQWRRDAGVLATVSSPDADGLAQVLWNQPAVSILALDAPRVAEVAHELVPSARALVSLRVAPGERADAAAECLLAHLRAHVPWGARLTTEIQSIVEPYAVDRRQALVGHAVLALTEAWGRPPLLVGEGASLPLVPALQARNSDLAVIATGVGDPTSRAHGPDESIALDDLHAACVAEGLLLRALAGG